MIKKTKGCKKKSPFLFESVPGNGTKRNDVMEEKRGRRETKGEGEELKDKGQIKR